MSSVWCVDRSLLALSTFSATLAVLALARLALGLRAGPSSPTAATSVGHKSILSVGLQMALVVVVSVLAAVSAVVTLVRQPEELGVGHVCEILIEHRLFPPFVEGLCATSGF